MNFFKKIYYQSNKCINLKEYGLNRDIILSEKFKMYNDLLTSIETFDIEYKKKNQLDYKEWESKIEAAQKQLDEIKSKFPILKLL